MFCTIVLFFSLLFSLTYSMEHAYELVPLLHEKDACVNEEESVDLYDYKQIQHNHLVEKLLLVRSMPEFLEAKIQNTILEYMLKPDRKKTDQEIMLDYQKKVALQQKTIVALRKAIHESIQKKYQYPDEIRCDINTCIDTARAATAGGCCGAMTGAGGMCIYGEIEGYMWCCCGVAPPKMLWNIFAWGFPISMGSGCLIGLLCVVCGLHKRIRCDL